MVKSQSNTPISPKAVMASSMRDASKSKFGFRAAHSLFKNLESASTTSSSCIPYDDKLIQSCTTRRKYMRRGSRAPSMMFQIEAAAAIIAEAEAAMLLHDTSIPSPLSNERCHASHIINRTTDIEPATDTGTSTDRNCLRSPSCTTLLGLQLQKSVNLP
jgi:hypothetical protein